MSLREIDLEELKQHKDARSPWLAIHDEVFDITHFIDEHPGGVEVLKEQAGGYATHAFEDVGHSKDARDMMKKYLIGTLKEGSKEKNKPGRRGVPYSTTEESSTATWVIPVGVAALIIGALVFYLNPGNILS